MKKDSIVLAVVLGWTAIALVFFTTIIFKSDMPEWAKWLLIFGM